MLWHLFWVSTSTQLILFFLLYLSFMRGKNCWFDSSIFSLHRKLHFSSFIFLSIIYPSWVCRCYLLLLLRIALFGDIQNKALDRDIVWFEYVKSYWSRPVAGSRRVKRHLVWRLWKMCLPARSRLWDKGVSCSITNLSTVKGRYVKGSKSVGWRGLGERRWWVLYNSRDFKGYLHCNMC